MKIYKLCLFIVLFTFCAGVTPSAAIDLGGIYQNQASFFSQHPEAEEKLVKRAFPITDDIDVEQLAGDARVVFLGEWHDEGNVIREVNFIIKKLTPNKKRSFGALGTEFLDTNEQKRFDQAVKKGTPKFFGFGDAKYMNTLAYAHSRKLKVIGLDMPEAYEDVQWGFSEEGITARNKSWTKIIKKYLEDNPQKRVLVWCGMFHALYGGEIKSVAEMLGDKGISTRVIIFSDWRTDSPWETLRQKYFPKTGAILFPVPKAYNRALGADAVWHLGRPMPEQMSELQRQRLQKMFETNYTDDCFTNPDSPICKAMREWSRETLP